MGRDSWNGPEPEFAGLTPYDPYRPQEPHTYGCPAAWYRNEFASSVFRYARRVNDHGFSPNILLDRCEDPLVLELIRLYEIEVLRARAHLDKVRHG